MRIIRVTSDRLAVFAFCAVVVLAHVLQKDAEIVVCVCMIRVTPDRFAVFTFRADCVLQL